MLNQRATSWHPLSHSQLFVLHPRYLWIPSMPHIFHFEPILTGLPGFGCAWSVIHIPILKQDASLFTYSIWARKCQQVLQYICRVPSMLFPVPSCSRSPLHSRLLHHRGQLPEMWQSSSPTPHQFSGMASATAAS